LEDLQEEMRATQRMMEKQQTRLATLIRQKHFGVQEPRGQEVVESRRKSNVFLNSLKPPWHRGLSPCSQMTQNELHSVAESIPGQGAIYGHADTQIQKTKELYRKIRESRNADGPWRRFMRWTAAHFSNSRRYNSSDLLLRAVESRTFFMVSMFFIVLHGMFIVVVSDLNARAAVELNLSRMTGSASVLHEPEWIGIVENCFTVIFTLEVALRMMGLELKFWFGPERRWNLLDLFLISVSITEKILSTMDLGYSFIKVLRIFRMLRSIRVIRLLRCFRALQLLLYSVLNSIVPLMWSVAFLCLILLVFVVISLQGSSEYLIEASFDDPTAVAMVQNLGSFSSAALMHFAAVTSGTSWLELYFHLSRLSPIYGWVFVAYIILMILMVLNIITGIFVNDAMELAQTNKELLSHAEEERKRALFDELQRLFEEFDTDSCGSITLPEFERAMDHESMQSIFTSLNLRVDDAVGVFNILDVDGSGDLEIDEFVIGVMNKMGDARKLDIDILMAENKQLLRKLIKSCSKTERKMDDIQVFVLESIGALRSGKQMSG